MFDEIKSAISESGVNMPEMINVSKAIDTLENMMAIAKTALSARVMGMVQNGDVEQLYKLRKLVEVFNEGESVVASTNTVTLSSDLKNHRPKNVKLGGESEDVSTWRGVSEAVLKALYKENPKKFSMLIQNADFESEKPYFAKSSENMSAPLMLGSGKDFIYADVSRVTNNDFFFLKKILTVLGHTADDVVIELDPEYSRKKIQHRKTKEEKAEAPKAKTSRKKTSSVEVAEVSNA